MTGYEPFDRDLDKVAEPLDQSQRRRRSGVVVLEDAVDKAQQLEKVAKRDGWSGRGRYAVVTWDDNEPKWHHVGRDRVKAVSVVSGSRFRELWDLRSSPPRRIRLRGMGR